MVTVGVPDIYHPFHFHGYAFSVISMGTPLGPITNNSTILTIDFLKQLQMNNQIRKNLKNPPAKDVIAVPNNGYVIFRFHATNPGTRHVSLLFRLATLATQYSPIEKLRDIGPLVNEIQRVSHFQGWWMLHCHFVYHQLVGMALAVQVGEQSDLPPVPKDFPKCGNYLPSIKLV